MKQLSRVVWSEGMYLGPHHFQVQNRYFEDSIQFASSALWFAPYGLLAWELDEEALRNGTLSLVHARGIFPDGMLFNMPECDPIPPTRNISNLISPTRNSVTIFLGIPEQKLNGMNCVLSDGSAEVTRYVAETRILHDENSGQDDKPIRLGRKNIQLLMDGEAAEDFVVLPLARIMRDGSGHLVLDSTFIPPCLSIAGSPRLLLILRGLLSSLDEKNRFLSNKDAHSGLSQRGVEIFWMLHAVNSNAAPLRHMYVSKRSHPEELYLMLCRLAGALCTFGLESSPKTLPAYDHDSLSDCFDGLNEHIQTHLGLMFPRDAIVIPLNRVKDYFYSGKVTDARALGRSRWLLGVRSSLGEADLISTAPRLIKICSDKFIARLVEQAFPGLVLTHLPVPPTQMSAKVEMQYFGISKSGPCWDSISDTSEVGVYVPGALPNPEIELVIILEK